MFRVGDDMKLLYADPPYIGQAKRHYNHDPSGIPAEEVNYPALIRQLKEADGWALSASSPSIFQLVPMINEVFPIGTVRVGAWVKPFASWKPTHRVQYAWEPVFFKPTRDKGNKAVPSVRDFVSANITMRKGTHGAKPDPFCDWVLNVLGCSEEDKVVDMFPGSGAFTRAVERKAKHG
jgi:hypothetical protein